LEQLVDTAQRTSNVKELVFGAMVAHEKAKEIVHQPQLLQFGCRILDSLWLISSFDKPETWLSSRVADLALLCRHDDFLFSMFANNTIYQCAELLFSLLLTDSAIPDGIARVKPGRYATVMLDTISKEPDASTRRRLLLSSRRLFDTVLTMPTACTDDNLARALLRFAVGHIHSAY
jgi:hypothetical protein